MKPTSSQASGIRFAVVDSALEGFRLTRERPGAVAAWAVALFAVNLAILSVVAELGLGPVVAAIRPFDPAPLAPDLVARAEAAGPWLPGLLAAFLALNAVLYCAVLRGVLEPADARFGYLRLGFQELRQLGLWLYALAALTALQVLLAVVEAGAAAAGQALQPEAARLVLASASAAVFLALFYPVVRLSIAPAMTFHERRVRLFSAWRLTRGQFWGMVGAYLVAGLLALAVVLLATVVIAPLISVVATLAGAGPQFLQAIARPPDMGSLQSFFTLETVISLATNALLMALVLAILAAPGPVIYLALRDGAAKG